MTADTVVIGEAQLRAMAAAIRAEIPGAEVRLFGSRARGEARPDSAVDLLLLSQGQVSQQLPSGLMTLVALDQDSIPGITSLCGEVRPMRARPGLGRGSSRCCRRPRC
jgi:predicted nucleotidyltransferase